MKIEKKGRGEYFFLFLSELEGLEGQTNKVEKWGVRVRKGKRKNWKKAKEIGGRMCDGWRMLR